MYDLRKLAKGKDCLLRFPGICCRDPATVVLCHLKIGWYGSSKPPDINAVYGCHLCHNVLDGRIQTEWSKAEIHAMVLRAYLEQIRYYWDNGIIGMGKV